MTADAIIGLIHALGPHYTRNAQWVINTAIARWLERAPYRARRRATMRRRKRRGWR